MGPAPVADAGHDGLVVEDLARIDERRVAGTVSGELGDSVKDLGDGVGNAVDDIGNAVGNAVEGR